MLGETACFVPTKSICKSISEGMSNTQLIVIDSCDDDIMEKVVEDAVKLTVADEQNIPSEEQEIIFDTTANEYRKQQKIPLFDTGNYFGRRRILSSMCLITLQTIN